MIPVRLGRIGCDLPRWGEICVYTTVHFTDLHYVIIMQTSCQWVNEPPEPDRWATKNVCHGSCCKVCAM